MDADVDSESDVNIQMEIQKTLICINDLTLKIKKELNIINQLVKDKGELGLVIAGANELLTKTARGMGIDVKKIVDKQEEEDDLAPKSLLDPITSLTITERLSPYLNGNDNM